MLRNRRGERELASSTDCAALARAMSFAIAVQIQPLAQEAESRAGLPPKEASIDDSADATGSPTPPVVAARPPRDARRSIDDRPSEERTRWQFLLGMGPTLAFGLAPRTAVEGRVFGGVFRGRFAFELGAEASLPSRYETAMARASSNGCLPALLPVAPCLEGFRAVWWARWAGSRFVASVSTCRTRLPGCSRS
jgi:hypothetical protein